MLISADDVKTKMKPPIRYGRLEKRVKNVIYYLQYLWYSPSYLSRIDHLNSQHLYSIPTKSAKLMRHIIDHKWFRHLTTKHLIG